MPTTPTIRRQVPLRDSNVSAPMQYWELETQQSAPLHEVDTSAGAYSENPPPAGLNNSTGQTAQNQELIYTKVSADANVWTLEGFDGNLPGGPYTLTTYEQTLRIKSNGSVWRKVN